MLTRDQAVKRIARVQANLNQAMAIVKAANEDLDLVRSELLPSQEELIERMHRQEERADTAKQHQALWGK